MKIARLVIVIVFVSMVVLIQGACAQDSDSTSQGEAAISSSLAQTMSGEEAQSSQGMQEMESTMEGNAGPRTPIDND